MSLPTKANLNDNPTEGEIKQALGRVYDTITSPYLRLSVASSSNNLVMALKSATAADPSSADPVAIMMRNPSLTAGYMIPVDFSAASGLTVPGGGSIGLANGATGKLYIWGVYDGTNKDIGVSGTQFHDESILHSTTTVGTGSDSSDTIYTTTGRTSASVKLLGEITITRGTDVWDASPTIQFVSRDSRRPILIVPYGCVPSNNGSDATNDMDFSAGVQLDSNREYMIIGTAMTKRADASWSVGTGNGGRASGAASWGAGDWHWFLVGKKNDPHANDYVLDDSAAGSHVLADSNVAAAGFNILKRAYSVRVPGAAWLSITAREIGVGCLEVLLKTPVFEFEKDWSGVDDAAQTGTLNGGVPGGIQVNALLQEAFQDTSASAASAILSTSLDQTDTAPSNAIGSYLADLKLTSNAGANAHAGTAIKRRTSTSRTFRYRGNSTTVDHGVGYCLQGWEDCRL